MSERLTYHKMVRPDILTEAIRLRTTLSKVYLGTHTIYGDEDLGDTVYIDFNRALTSSEKDEITAIINALGPSYDLQVRKDIEQKTMKWAMETGRNILAQFAANNLYREKTSEQIESLLSEQCELIEALLTGSLTVAYSKFLRMVPNDNISQEEIDEFKIRLETELGI